MTHWGHSFDSNAHLLSLLTPEGSEQIIALVDNKDLKIGCSPDADLRLEGPGIAPRHCRIYEQGGRLRLVDHGSPAGTLINDQRCVEPTELRENDRIGVGLYLLRVLPGRAHLGTEAIARELAYEPPAWAGQGDFFVPRLEQEARAWADLGRPRRLLLHGERLERAIALSPRPPALEPWLQTSAAHQRRLQGARWFLCGLVPGLLVGGLVAAPALSSPAAPPPAPAASSTAPSPLPPPASACTPIRHQVIPHETLAEVAALLDVDLHQLAAQNGLDPNSPISAGTKLSVCAFRLVPERHRVAVAAGPDDTWESLARKHGLSVDKLRAYNPGLTLTPGARVELWTSAPPPAIVERADPVVPAGAGSAGKVTDGALDRGINADSRLYDIRCKATAYASSHTLLQLKHAIHNFRKSNNYTGQLIVGDLSKKEGGRYGPHASHQSGRDVDLWLPVMAGVYRQDEDRCQRCGTSWCRPDPEEADWDATLRLIQALVAVGSVQHIFLDRQLHPALREAARRAALSPEDIDRLIQPAPGKPAAVTHEPRHTRHLHVRFRCGPDEPGCRD